MHVRASTTDVAVAAEWLNPRCCIMFSRICHVPYLGLGTTHPLASERISRQVAGTLPDPGRVDVCCLCGCTGLFEKLPAGKRRCLFVGANARQPGKACVVMSRRRVISKSEVRKNSGKKKEHAKFRGNLFGCVTSGFQFRAGVTRCCKRAGPLCRRHSIAKSPLRSSTSPRGWAYCE